MKRILAVVFLLLSLFSASALSESYSTYSTGHFFFKAPTTWLKNKSGDYLYLYAGRYQSTDGGFLMAAETRIGIVEPAEDLYSDFISGFTGDAQTEKESIMINDVSSVCFSFDYPGAVPFRLHSVACYKSGYILSLSYADTLSDDIAVKKVLLDIAASVSFSPDLCDTDEERIAFAASSVYGDALIASRSGKYPTIDVREYGSADKIRSLTNEKAFDFLRKIREYRDTVGMEFLDIRINVYTNVMDVYGNTSEKQVLGFNISAEDIDKINFEKMPVENIPKIAFNWYENPVMK